LFLVLPELIKLSPISLIFSAILSGFCLKHGYNDSALPWRFAVAGKRKTPKLRIDGVYYNVKVYDSHGKRRQISFGHVDDRIETKVNVAFAKWLELYAEDPEKALSYKNPYQAVDEFLNTKTVITVKEFLDYYLSRAERDLRKTREGKNNPDLTKIARAVKFMRPYYSRSVESFGPDELKKIQNALVKYKYKASDKSKKKKLYTRRTINDTINYIHTIWNWGLGRGIVNFNHVRALKEVKSLTMGQNLHENNKRSPVSEEEFQKVVKVVNSTVGDMLRLIWYTAMLPYEVCEMRPIDIIADDSDCWLYIPGRDKTPIGYHKTTRFGRVKVIPLTKKCQEILKPRIQGLSSRDYIFRPENTMIEVRRKRSENRKTPLHRGNRSGTNRSTHPICKPGKKYNHNTLCRACKRSCKRAKVKDFTPYDLRRTMATGTREILGKEAATLLLGHAKSDTTIVQS
jgi:integrase